MTSSRPLPIVIVGHVDHGKSTLIGRLLHDTGSLPEGKLDEVEALCRRRGVDFEWSFVMDALQLERDQGITLDTTRIWFSSPARGYVIIDAPGHEQFLKNMVTGAASADAAVLVVDATEGVSEQTRRHAYLLTLIGVPQVVVAVNKMDLVGFDARRFAAVAGEVRDYLERIGLHPAEVVPLSARGGDNLAAPSAALDWWRGATLLAALDALPSRPAAADRPLRLPVQDVYREGDRRVLVGRIDSGRLRLGDALRFLPTGRTARVASMEGAQGTAPIAAVAGQSVAITLDDDLFVERGHIAAAPDAPPAQALAVRARVFWLDERPVAVDDSLTLKLGTAAYPVRLEAVERVIDTQDLGRHQADTVGANEIAEVVLRSPVPILFDPAADNRLGGRGVLARDYRLVGGCILEGPEGAGADTIDRNLTEVAPSVAAGEIAAANGHAGGVLWLTGLSGAGKSTLAMALRRRLFAHGWQTAVLDGDNLRTRLNADLGFTPADRSENIRRTAEVARLMAEAGQIVVVALISPLAEDRRRARRIIGDGFHEVHVSADLAVCEARDPKGLYARARAGAIRNFTGVDAPYEPPEAPELTVDTTTAPPADAVDRLAAYATTRFALPAGTRRRVP